MVRFLGKRLAELAIPPAARDDERSFEIVRVWSTAQGLSVVLKSEVWKDPAAYGIMLADLARHIANAFRQVDGRDTSATLGRILEGLNAELDSPTDTPTGALNDKSGTQ